MELESTKQQLNALQYRYGEMEALLRSRESDLTGLKRSLQLNRDEHSNADIADRLDLIGALTEEIASSTYDWPTISPSEVWKPSAVSVIERQELEGQIGRELVLCLANTRVGDDAAFPLLQYAWSGLIARGVSILLERFSTASPGLPAQDAVDSTLLDLGRKIRESEPHAVYAHWRAMTHKYLQASISKEEQTARMDKFSEWICAMCYRAGCLLVQDKRPSGAAFREKLQGQITGVLDQTLTLARMLREEMLSNDFHPYRPDHGVKFDPSLMDLEEDEEVTRDDTVICTTAVGLVSLSSSRTDGQGAILKRAKVLTKTGLGEIPPAIVIEEASPPRKSSLWERFLSFFGWGPNTAESKQEIGGKK